MRKTDEDCKKNPLKNVIKLVKLISSEQSNGSTRSINGDHKLKLEGNMLKAKITKNKKMSTEMENMQTDLISSRSISKPQFKSVFEATSVVTAVSKYVVSINQKQKVETITKSLVRKTCKLTV